MEVDTGAAFSVSSKNTYQELFSTLPLQHSPVKPKNTYQELLSTLPLQHSPVKLKTYSGESLPVFGSINVEVSYDKQQKPLSLLVVGLDVPSLLGRNWLSELRLNWYSLLQIEKNSLDQLLHKYSSVFEEGLGTLEGFKAKLYVANDVKPWFIKARPVPYAICSLVNSEINRLVEQNVIVSQTGPPQLHW